MESKDLKNLIESYYSMYEESEETISEGEMEQERQVEKYREMSRRRAQEAQMKKDRPSGKPSAPKKDGPKLGYGAKGFKGGALESVETEAEMIEPYDIILNHLIDEGFASSVENAEKIMGVMSDEWILGIMEQETKMAKFTVTDIDRKLNTPAYQRYRQGNPNYQGGGEGANKLKEA
jgi:hypothetical protein